MAGIIGLTLNCTGSCKQGYKPLSIFIIPNMGYELNVRSMQQSFKACKKRIAQL